MPFVSLGITNVRRNLGRSTLSLIGMALAAMILSSSLPVAEGYPKTAYLGQRLFIGGDIIVYPGRFRPNRTEIGQASQDKWVFDRLPEDYMSDLASFNPEYYGQGFLRTPHENQIYLDAEALSDRLSEHRGFISSVSFYQSVPGLVSGTDSRGLPRTWFSPLRARNISVDAENGYERVVASGRGFRQSDEGRFLAMADATRGSLPGYTALVVGSSFDIQVPEASLGSDGNYVFDYSSLHTYTFDIIGEYSLPTRVLTWQDDMGGVHTEQLYWTTPQILVPESTLSAIWNEVSGLENLPVSEAAISVNNLAYLENNAADLAKSLPEYTVMSVPSQTENAWLRGLPEPVFRYPLPLSDPDDIRQAGTPMDLRNVVVFITYAISALLVASNMLVSLASRRKEIGILKALGAKSYEVMLMVMSEVLAVSMVGAFMGFLLLRVKPLWQYISNRMSFQQIGILTLAELGRVMGATVGFALLFGVVPALFTSKMAAMDVLRNE